MVGYPIWSIRDIVVEFAPFLNPFLTVSPGYIFRIGLFILLEAILVSLAETLALYWCSRSAQQSNM